MKRKGVGPITCIVAFVVLCIFLFWKYGDTKQSVNNKADTSVSQKEDTTGEGTVGEPKEDVNVTKEGKMNLVWVIPDYYDISKNNLKKFNDKLHKDGYKFSLTFQYIMGDDYMKELSGILEERKADIAFVGTNSAKDPGIVTSFLQKGYFEELSGYLGSEQGKSLYHSFDPSIWKGVEVDGKRYTIPNSTATDGRLFIALNKEYISDEEANRFSGKLEELLPLIESKNVDVKTVTPILYTAGSFSYLNAQGYEYLMGLFLNCKTGKVENPYSTEEMKSFLFTMNQMYKKGYLNPSMSLVNNYYSEDIEKQIQEGKFIAWIGEERAVLRGVEDKVTVRDMPFYIKSRNSASVGIAKEGSHKEEALQLLSLLHSNPEYANLLLLGEEGVDYKLENGIAYDMSGEAVQIYAGELALGLYDSVAATQSDVFIDRKKKAEMLQSSLRQDSVLLGFQLNTSNFNEEYYKVKSVTQSFLDVWKEENFDTKYKEAIESVEQSSAMLQEEMGRQISQWDK